MKHKGFTLVEMIVVIGILGILLSIAVPGIKENVDRSRERERFKHEEVINMAVRQYYAIELRYPSGGKELEELVNSDYIKIDENMYEYVVTQGVDGKAPIIAVKIKK